MCGIAGVCGINAEESSKMIQKMTDALIHRGPDSGDVKVYEKIALGQRRLSIIDLSSAANQPFFDVSKRYAMVFNGEIYNYESVKQLIDYPWQTNSDTEVIMAAYLKWGSDCLKHLNGMFAFTIWDNESETLFMARDRLGVKPLYYYHDNEVLVFCSEIRAMLTTNLIKRELNIKGLGEYFCDMAVKTPHSIIKDIEQVKPGEFILFEKGKLIKNRYWQLLDANQSTKYKNNTYKETLLRTRTLFEEGVKSRMVADVPVGAFLSGGIDSSAIVAVMADLSKEPIHTFSIIFEDKAYDESEYARLIAEKYKTQHTELLLKPNEVLNMLDEYFSKMDTPTLDGINSYIVSKLVAQTGIKVAMSGLGGDELFAGYAGFARYKTFKKYAYISESWAVKMLVQLCHLMFKTRTSQKLLDYFDQKKHGLETFYANSRSIFLKKELRSILKTKETAKREKWCDLADERITEYDTFSQYSIAELSNYTLEVLLKDTDQMSMAWGLEVREPFFDYHLVEYILTVKDAYKQNGKSAKSLFVESLKDLLPEEIIYRTKKGFSFPWDTWIRGELKTYCEEAIKSIAKRKMFDEVVILKLWQNFIEQKQGIIWLHIWSLVVLEKWLIENKM
jgi:asparagine synthase (glutamine-hydrolysing)